MGYRGIAYKRRRKDSYEKTEQDTRRTYYTKKDVGVLKKTNSYDSLTSTVEEKRGRKSSDDAIGNRKTAKKNRSTRYKKK